MTTLTDVSPEREELLRAYSRVRSTTEALCEPLEPEDMVVQTMPDVSPTKWHLAHTTWFFETLVLQRSGVAYEPYDERFSELFNSYYQSLGDPHPRDQRGLLSRPTVEEVRAYRKHVDMALAELLAQAPDAVIERVRPLVMIGLHHEEQHQELLLMDTKHVLGQNPLRPAYRADSGCASGGPPSDTLPRPAAWRSFEGGEVEVGSAAEGFSFDNERPRHSVRLVEYELASHPVTAGEYRAFMADGGYQRSELWLADGWDRVQRDGWRAPLYWEESSAGWCMMTLRGLRNIDPEESVCHLSYYEADAYATWAGCRLPTEFEWEHAAEAQAVEGNFLESDALHPRARHAESNGEPLAQLFGNVWEWTSSPYAPYSGYEPFEGALGEYNGKFMINQMVLRGGCCVTPEQHMRRTYRNFYYPHQRWMFSGLRLAR